MSTSIWTIVTAVATLVSMLAYIVTALYIRAELKALDKDRYLTVTSELFNIWQDQEFLKAQMWLVYHLQEDTWERFTAAHRADYGEIAFHRVGSFYDRVGTLIEMKIVNDKELLSTLGGYAISVWQRIEPLVKEARRVENSALFDNFERMLPACYECYVPSLAEGSSGVFPVASSKRPSTATISLVKEAPLVSIKDLKKKLEQKSDVVVLDVRQAKHVAVDSRRIPGEIQIPPEEIDNRFSELPIEKEIDVFCA